MKRWLATQLRRLAWHLYPTGVKSFNIVEQAGQPTHIDIRFVSGKHIVGYVDSPIRRLITEPNMSLLDDVVDELSEGEDYR